MSEAAKSPPKPLDMAELSALATLPLRARCLADAIGVGRHRSHRRGASIEFADYRDYRPGDDLRRVDWRLLARTDRAHIRQTHEETPLRVLLLLDVSASMQYRSRPGLMTKLDYARCLLAALALIVRHQRDACGIGLLGPELTSYLAPSTSPGRLRSVWSTLDQPATDRVTPLARTLGQAADASRRACLFVVASDFHEDPEALDGFVRRAHFEQHDVLALHVVDPEEQDFTFRHPAPFIDPETGQELAIDPVVVADQYRAAFANHQRRLQEMMVPCGFAHVALRTDAAPLQGLGAYLARRAGKA